MLNYTRIPAPRVTLVDPQTGVVANEWFRFFNNLYTIAYAATGSVTAGTYGSATAVPQITVDDFGGITAVTNVPIAIDASQIVSGTIASARISGSYTGITGVGTLTVGTWNALTIGVGYGGTGQTSYTDGQLLIGNSTGNTLTKATLTAGTAIGISNGAGAITITNTLPDQTVVLTNGTGINVTGTYPNFTITNTAPSSGGTVTSVTGTSPVVSSGGTTPAISLATAYGDTLNPYASKTANYFLAAPNGSAGGPTFRAMVAADVPALAYVTSVSGTGSVNGITLTGTVTSSGSLTLGGTLSGIGNSQLTNSTISGVALGGSLFNLTAGTGVTFSTGTTYNGSAAITINATGTGGTVTSVAALTIGTTGTDLSSTVANGTTTPVITLQVPTASSVNRGALSAADWTTFNSKAPGVTFTTNYIPYGQGTTTLNQSAGLQFDGTNFTTTGSATATGFIPSGSTIPTNGMYLPAANSVGFATNSTNAIYINSSQNVGIGATSPGYLVEVSRSEATTYSASSASALAPFSSTSAALIVRNTSNTASSGSYIGLIGIDGAGTTNLAYIGAITVNASFSSNIVFGQRTGSTAYTERMRIDAAGNTYVEKGTLWQYAPAPTSKAAVATLTAAEVATGILNTTGTTYTVTLPTGTQLDTQFPNVPAVNIGFDWFVINTASGTITIAVGASGMTSLGTLTIATGVSAQFRLRRTAANTYVLYRLG